MNKKGEILVVDDEPQIRKLLEITLESNDYLVRQAASAKEAMVIAATHPTALIILDLGLPDEDGQQVLIQLRQWYTNPIIILSVKSNQDDIITALDNGANDYLVKPFRTGELLARIRSAIRTTLPAENAPLITCNDIDIDFAARIVKRCGDIVKLTATEYNLLAMLVKNRGRVLTHQYLLREIWGPGYINQSQYLRVFVAQLRKKIETDPNRPEYIVTESGVGYRFACDD